MTNPIDSSSFQYPGISPWSPQERASAARNSQSQFPPEIDGVSNKENPTAGTIKKGRLFKECQTCKRRKYVDVSNDPGVSFKAPTSVSPGAEAMAVSAHENQHVANEQGKAMRQGREVVYQTVQVYTGVCPECGRVYVAGGKTTTVTRAKPENPGTVGRNVDLKV